MSLLFAITLLIIAVVNLYCYSQRNTSIADVTTFWISAFFVMLFTAIAFIFDYLKVSDNYYIVLHIATTIAGFFLCRTSILNIKGDWETLKNTEEVKEQVQFAKQETMSYVDKALEELPDQKFSKELQEKIAKKLKKQNV